MSSIACCSGSLHTGVPKGNVITIAGVQAYVAEPANTAAKAIVIATDVFGYTLPNVRLIADAFAEHGFVVLVPDLFNGQHVSFELFNVIETPAHGLLQSVQKSFKMLGWVLFNVLPWLLKHRPINTLPTISKVINAVRSEFGVEKVYAQGYCYGGKVAAHLARDPRLVDRAVLAHPSMMSVPSDIEAIKVPTLFVFAENDMAYSPKQQQQTQVVLGRKPDCAWVRFQGTEHGFAVRGKEDDPVVAQARMAALQAAVDFFNKD